MNSTSSSNPGPGNFGFLRTPLGNGANVLAEALATGNPGACYTQDSLDTKTGAVAGPVEAGVNTRFGIYEGSFKGSRNDGRYRPAQNVRSAQKQTGQNGCKDYDPAMVGSAVGDVTKAVPLGYGSAMSTLGGGKISSSNNWNYANYWSVAQGGTPPSVSAILSNHSSYPPTATGTPSLGPPPTMSIVTNSTPRRYSTMPRRTARSAIRRQAAASAIRDLPFRTTRRTSMAIVVRSSPRSSIAATKHRSAI